MNEESLRGLSAYLGEVLAELMPTKRRQHPQRTACAEACGVSFTTLQRWIDGETSIPVEALPALSEYLDKRRKSPRWLIDMAWEKYLADRRVANAASQPLASVEELPLPQHSMYQEDYTPAAFETDVEPGQDWDSGYDSA